MALVTFEGLDQFEGATTVAAQLLSKGWAALSWNASTTGRFGGRGMSQVTSQWLRWDFAAPITTATIGWAFQCTGTNSSAREIAYFCDGGGTTQFGLGINNSNKLFVWRGSTSTVVATSTTGLLPLQWYFLELQATIHNTTGAYEVRLNGTQIADLTATGVNTRSTANNQMTGVLFGGTNSPSSGHLFDDIYITDTSGSSNTGFMGEIRVQTIVPTATGSSTGFTPSASTNWSNVDEIGSSGHDSDTTYNSSGTAGAIDMFGTGGSAVLGSPTVHAVAITTVARKDDVGVRVLRNRLKSSSTVATGSNVTLNSVYSSQRTVWEQNPATSTSWTASTVNAAEIGYELVS